MTALGYLRKNAVGALQNFQSQSTCLRKSLRIFLRNASSLVPKRVLIVGKLTRYYFERLREPNLNEEQFKRKLLSQGLDYESILDGHCATEEVESKVEKVLKKLNIEYKKVNRSSISRSKVEWADFILPIGGDGTFLLAANLIFDNKTPILGINSYPKRSEGFLMLPAYYTNNVPEIFELLKAGEYDILMRSRIRVTLTGDNIWEAPFHMHEEGSLTGAERYFSNGQLKPSNSDQLNRRQLPWLALNEVFVSEIMAAKTSTLLMKFDDKKDFYRIKCSGICICTGTGSTAWYKAINNVTPQAVRKILSLANSKKSYRDDEINKICSDYNNTLKIDPEGQHLCYAIRDMVVTAVSPVPKSLEWNNMCKKLIVRSLCLDGGLVLDTGIAVRFNLGTTAEFEVDPEGALRTIVLPHRSNDTTLGRSEHEET